MNSTILSAFFLTFFGAARVFGADAALSSAFDLQGWKLQIPGPKDVKQLQNYSSKYFYLDEHKEMCFWLDAADKGTTPGAKYVRSELRHLPNWKASETHALSAEFHLNCHLKPDKITVVQIHGITVEDKDAPPLLRVAVNNGDLVAVVQHGNGRHDNDTLVLKKDLGSEPVTIDVAVKAEQLTIRLDGQEKLNRSLTFWKYLNYFKAGCYPQATEGTALVMFRKLTAH
jgi:hypothetical protein